MKVLIRWLEATAWAMLVTKWDFWQATVLAGILPALVLPTGRAMLAAGLAGAVGWTASLLWVGDVSDLNTLAQLVAGIVGLGDSIGPLVVLALPALLGGLLAACGAWTAGALRQRFATTTASDVNDRRAA